MIQFYVYILTNRRYGVLYVGVTNNLPRRISEHRQKLVPGFTKTYGVTRLVYFEEYSSIAEARAREHSLKRWRRTWKLDLVDRFNPEWRDLAGELVLAPRLDAVPRMRCGAISAFTRVFDALWRRDAPLIRGRSKWRSA